MIQQISKVQKVASGTAGSVIVNASLPVSIKVAEKTGYNRYNLKFGNRILSTKSLKNLKIGGEYWGEIGNGTESIVIQNLYEKPIFSHANALSNGLDLIEKLINEPNTKWFYDFIAQALATTKTKNEFEIYTEMLLALQKNVIYIPFIYGANVGIFQMRNSQKQNEIYLIFSNFPPILFSIKNGNITSIVTPFKKLSVYLQDEFGVKAEMKNVEQIYKLSSQIVDFKG